MKTIARTLLLSLGLAATALAAAPSPAAACGYYKISEADRARGAVIVFLRHAQDATVGVAKVAGARARVDVEIGPTDGDRVRQTYSLVKRDGAWKVVDFTAPTRVPARAVALR